MTTLQADTVYKYLVVTHRHIHTHTKTHTHIFIYHVFLELCFFFALNKNSHSEHTSCDVVNLSFIEFQVLQI